MTAEFDRIAADYDAQLGMGLSLTGDSADYYARGRLLLLRDHLDRLGYRADRVIDFGCGTGRSVPLIRECLAAASILGVDTSEESLAIAAAAFGSPAVGFSPIDKVPPGETFDLVFTNGVFHHIPPADRPAALAWIRAHLRPDGLFALWENNPWNPGTRLVMRRIPFDRDAVTLSPPVARRLLRGNGFRVLRTAHGFFFPAPLRVMRPLERCLRKVPLGGQYMMLATLGAYAG